MVFGVRKVWWNVVIITMHARTLKAFDIVKKAQASTMTLKMVIDLHYINICSASLIACSVNMHCRRAIALERVTARVRIWFVALVNWKFGTHIKYIYIHKIGMRFKSIFTGVSIRPHTSFSILLNIMRKANTNIITRQRRQSKQKIKADHTKRCKMC